MQTAQGLVHPHTADVRGEQQDGGWRGARDGGSAGRDCYHAGAWNTRLRGAGAVELRPPDRAAASRCPGCRDSPCAGVRIGECPSPSQAVGVEPVSFAPIAAAVGLMGAAGDHLDRGVQRHPLGVAWPVTGEHPTGPHLQSVGRIRGAAKLSAGRWTLALATRPSVMENRVTVFATLRRASQWTVPAVQLARRSDSCGCVS